MLDYTIGVLYSYGKRFSEMEGHLEEIGAKVKADPNIVKETERSRHR
jgi:hypothetical protein